MRLSIAAIVALLLPTLAAGQEGDKWFGTSWSMASPTDHSKTFTNDYSFRGVGLDWRSMRGRMSVGLSLGWNLLNEETARTSTMGQVDVTGDQFRYTNVFSILATTHTYMGTVGGPRPFVGLRAGTYYIRRRVDVGLWTASDNNWHLGIAPELGFAVPLRGRLSPAAFYTAVRYNYAFSAGDAPYQSWVAIDIGLAARKW